MNTIVFTSGRIVPLNSNPHGFRPWYWAYVPSDPGVRTNSHTPSNSQGFDTAIGHRQNLLRAEDDGIRRKGSQGNIKLKPTELINCGHDKRLLKNKNTVNADVQVSGGKPAENELIEFIDKSNCTSTE